MFLLNWLSADLFLLLRIRKKNKRMVKSRDWAKKNHKILHFNATFIRNLAIKCLYAHAQMKSLTLEAEVSANEKK